MMENDFNCAIPGNTCFDETRVRSLRIPELLSRCLGNRDLVLRLITRFQQSAGELKNLIEEALSELKFESAGLLAHRLKGEAANLGAAQIRESAASIEQACLALSIPSAMHALSLLKKDYDQLQAQLPQLIKEVATSDPDPKIPSIPKR